jgi:hypothetical protein
MNSHDDPSAIDLVRAGVRVLNLAPARLIWHRQLTMSIDGTNKRGRGRPPVGSTPINLRLPPDQLATLDAWISRQAGDVSRPEAVRQLLATALRDVQG